MTRFAEKSHNHSLPGVWALISLFLLLGIFVSCTSAAKPDPEPAGSLFRFVRSEQVTPDYHFLAGGFIRIGYVPARGQLVAAFGSPKLAKAIGECGTTGKAYKVYTLDLQPTGEEGLLHCGSEGDTTNLFVDDTVYDIMPTKGSEGWVIKKYDSITWKEQASITYQLDSQHEQSGDMTIALVNGVLDVSGSYSDDGHPPAIDHGAATSHIFFTPDLQFLEKRILADTPHIVGSSMIYVNGVYHFISASAYAGDVIVMKYDQNWAYLGKKILRTQAHWPEGVAWDGQRFYLTYLDTSQRDNTVFWPYFPNVHLAAFDRDWNLVEDVAVTDYAPNTQFTGRPHLLLHGNRVYVGYDVVPLPEDLSKIEVYIAEYELTR
jgi:hypothetical protein